MISWAVIVIGLLTSFCFTDFGSSSVIESEVCPALFLLFVFYLIVRITFSLDRREGAGGGMVPGVYVLGDSSHAGGGADSCGSSDGGCSGS